MIFTQLNRVLRELFVHDIPLKKGEFEIAFDQPTREWSAKVGRPTLNLFLYDFRENRTLRQTDWEQGNLKKGKVTRRRKPTRIDLQYLITAWGTKLDDQLNLLGYALESLLRHSHLPPPLEMQAEMDKDFWRNLAEQWPTVLKEQPYPIAIRAAQPDVLRNPAEVWSALSNELRPSLVCTITVALMPHRSQTVSTVRERKLTFDQGAVQQRQQFKPLQNGGDETATGDTFFTISGHLSGSQNMAAVRMTLVERDLKVLLQEDGRYIISNLTPGDYTLEISVAGNKLKQHRFRVPDVSYDINL